MNELLDYVSNIVEELEVIRNRINCFALSEEIEHLDSIAERLSEKVKYYKGFAAKEDKKSVRYFMTKMTQKEFSDLQSSFPIVEYKFNTIKKEDIKD